MADRQIKVVRIVTLENGFRRTMRFGQPPDKLLCFPEGGGGPVHTYWQAWPPPSLDINCIPEAKVPDTLPGTITVEGLAVLKPPQSNAHRFIRSITPVLIPFTDCQIEDVAPGWQNASQMDT